MTTTHLSITRRTFLACAGKGAAALLASLPSARAAVPIEAGRDAVFEPDVALELTASSRPVVLRGTPATPVLTYRARVAAGDPASVRASPGGYLGPTLRVHRGQKLRIDFVNHLDQPSIINWHGLHVPADMMGLPRYEVKPGERYRYEFEVRDRAGTYWYHAMAAGHTPEQVYFGLAGLLLVSDEEEQALTLPRGEYDLPFVIQDRSFGEDNRLRYLSGGMGDRMTRMMGFFGDTILVNGQPAVTLEVATHAYRLRVLNASNARTYKLGWEDGRPLVVIATGGGLLERPLQKGYVMLTPGQRVELWADFSKDAAGTRLRLMSLAFDTMAGMMEGAPGASGMGGGMTGGGMMENMMRGMMAGSPLADGARFVIATVVVARGVNEALELPRHLATPARLRIDDAANRNHPRTFRITMGHMQWGFNDRSFRMDDVAADEIVTLGTTEVWEFTNSMMMAHAIHLHGLQFQVLERHHSPEHAGVVDGCVDAGWEDTVLLMPGESVKLLMRFADFTGTYAYQCHMLEHAATGLMRNYEVRPAHASASLLT